MGFLQLAYLFSTQLFSRRQNNDGKEVRVFIKTQPGPLLNTPNTDTVIYKKKVCLFFKHHICYHIIKIYFVIFHIFYSLKAIEKTVIINTLKRDSFLLKPP